MSRKNERTLYWSALTPSIFFISHSISGAKCLRRSARRAGQLVKMWTIVSWASLQYWQIGGWAASPVLSMRYPWVAFVWPIFTLLSTTSSCLFRSGYLVHGWISSLMIRSFGWGRMRCQRSFRFLEKISFYWWKIVFIVYWYSMEWPNMENKDSTEND